ncbi:MAG: phosphotransferase [Halobacteriovoraceae bacterium]|jgi:N-acetylmuramate 1-kinase|nr:phosphotransferase [Halobacteriovoraceae bacterium]
MKPEVSERLFIEDLFRKSKERLKDTSYQLNNIERLTGDASTRRYYRLFTEKKSFVACLDNPSQTGLNPFISVLDFLKDYRLRIPHIYDMDLSKGYILEEDLGDTTLLKHLSTIGSKEEEFLIYKEILDQLLVLHKIPQDEIKKSGIFQEMFDYTKLKSEIDFTTDFFLKRYLGITDEDSLARVSEVFDPLCKRLASENMVLTHRDFHSRNIMVKDKDFVMIDFQDARLGIPQYDLVSMLEDCYYRVGMYNKNMLIKYYYENLPVEIHQQKDFESFMKLYNDMALQRVFKAIGSFSYIYETRKDIRYLKYIGFAMEKIKSILFDDNTYDELRKTLFKYYYES